LLCWCGRNRAKEKRNGEILKDFHDDKFKIKTQTATATGRIFR
jgi:hypothetical protein